MADAHEIVLMPRTPISKNKILIFILTPLFVVLVATLFLWWLHSRSSKPDYTGTCAGYYTGIYAGPDSIQSMANDYSQVVVIATAEDPETLKSSAAFDPAPLVRITQVLKGKDKVHKGDIIPICSGMGYIDLQKTKHPVVLLFLEGKDGSTWVPSVGYPGIPQNKDGSFTVGYDRKKPITVDELKKLIR